METTMISNEAYAKIVNLLKTFYMQGFEDAANCPEPVDMSEDIEKQLNTIGIQCNDSLWIQHLDAKKEYELHKYENEWDRCYEEDKKAEEDIDNIFPNLNTIDYVLASTSYMVNETYLFRANADGEVTEWGEIGSKAERWGDEDWRDVNAVMEQTFGDQAKHFKIIKEMWGAGPQYLFQRIKGDE